MTTRRYTARFFQAQSGASNEGKRVSDILLGLEKLDEPVSISLGGSPFEIRHITDNRSTIWGVFARIRNHDLPHAGRRGGGERELGLSDDEGLLEKAHFVVSKKTQVMALQFNSLVGYHSKLAAYLTDLASETISLNPILQPDAARRLISQNVRIKEFDVAVARPNLSTLVEPAKLAHLWNKTIMEVMASTGAYRMRMVIGADGHSNNDSRYITGKFLQSLGELARNVVVRRARVKFEGGDAEGGMVDLLADQLAADIEVESNGRYPHSFGMWTELDNALRRSKNEIAEVLGLEL